MGASAELYVLHHHPQAGRAAGPFVVLVHGSLDRATSFARVVRRLPELTVVTYDRRGYNHSRHVTPTPPKLDGHVEDLVAIVGKGPAVVVGHSFGGDVAIGAAVAAPEAVVAVGAFEPPMPWIEWWPKRPRRPGEEKPEHFAEGFFRRMVGDSAWDRLPESTRQARRAEGPALMAELASLRGDAAPIDPARIAVPSVFGRGELSAPHHRRAVEQLASTVPGARLFEIEGAGHGAHLSHPGAFAEMVRDLWRRAAGVGSAN
ncbi:MAG: alpha/beta fold hydrolase [Acidimicrobiales bacterium]